MNLQVNLIVSFCFLIGNSFQWNDTTITMSDTDTTTTTQATTTMAVTVTGDSHISSSLWITDPKPEIPRTEIECENENAKDCPSGKPAKCTLKIIRKEDGGNGQDTEDCGDKSGKCLEITGFLFRVNIKNLGECLASAPSIAGRRWTACKKENCPCYTIGSCKTKTKPTLLYVTCWVPEEIKCLVEVDAPDGCDCKC